VELLRDPDADLVAACRDPGAEGFESAFEQLFGRYRDRVYAIAFRVVGNGVDALDVVQESFALLFRKLHEFRGASLFSTWLFRIVVNCSIDQRRRRDGSGRIHAVPMADDLDDGPADEAPSPADRASALEVGDQVQAAMGLLSPKLRAILALRYLEDMSYDELAATLGLSLGTVKSRMSRAHLALEAVVRSHFPHLEIDLAARRATGDAG
jgi:RNA polymerase sigma factor (sigma-70 family)